MICLPNRNRAFAVSSIRVLVRNRIGAPLTTMTSPWRSSSTSVDMLRPLILGHRGVQSPEAVTDLLSVPHPGNVPRLLEQGQQALRRLIGDRQRLSTELLLDLQRLQQRRLLGEVGIDQRSKAGIQRIDLVAVV